MCSVASLYICDWTRNRNNLIGLTLYQKRLFNTIKIIILSGINIRWSPWPKMDFIIIHLCYLDIMIRHWRRWKVLCYKSNYKVVLIIYITETSCCWGRLHSECRTNKLFQKSWYETRICKRPNTRSIRIGISHQGL